jgi:hypothetical protein
MNESEVVSSPRHLASKDVHVEIHGRFEIANPKNEMVEALSLKWDHVMWPSQEAAKSWMKQGYQACLPLSTFPRMPLIGRALKRT